jgi:hypothetical protein
MMGRSYPPRVSSCVSHRSSLSDRTQRAWRHAPTYTLGAANATVTATLGGMATQTVNITRTGGFAEGLPSLRQVSRRA